MEESDRWRGLQWVSNMVLTLLLKRAHTDDWLSPDAPQLQTGEIGWDSDTNSLKVGDSNNAWVDLEHVGLPQHATSDPGISTLRYNYDLKDLYWENEHIIIANTIVLNSYGAPFGDRYLGLKVGTNDLEYVPELNRWIVDGSQILTEYHNGENNPHSGKYMDIPSDLLTGILIYNHDSRSWKLDPNYELDGGEII